MAGQPSAGSGLKIEASQRPTPPSPQVLEGTGLGELFVLVGCVVRAVF